MTTAQTKEVAKKPAGALSNYKADVNLLNQAPAISKDHLRLSKVKIHQGTTQGRAGNVGELFSVPDLLKLADIGQKITFYPITYKLSWYHNKKGPQDKKPVPTGITPWENSAQFKWSITDKDGVIYQNFQTVTFFCVLESDLEAGISTPRQVVLSSTSFTSAGLPLMNKYDEIKRHNIEPWLMKFTLSSEQSKKGAWQVFKVEPVADKTGQVRADEKHWATLRQWTSTLFELNNRGDLKQTVEDLAADVEESVAATNAPLNEEQLPY